MAKIFLPLGDATEALDPFYPFFRLQEDGLYLGVLLPNLVVASVGGGVALPSQRAALEAIDCYGQGKAVKLAEIVAATALCLDLSTASAIAADHFVQAHERLGRNRPKTGRLSLEDLPR